MPSCQPLFNTTCQLSTLPFGELRGPFETGMCNVLLTACITWDNLVAWLRSCLVSVCPDVHLFGCLHGVGCKLHLHFCTIELLNAVETLPFAASLL